MRMPAAKARAAKSSGARVKRTGSCSIAPMLRLAGRLLEARLRAGRCDSDCGGAAVLAMNSRSPDSVNARESNAFEGSHGLQMECLWKQVYQGEGNGSIPGWLQRAEVPGQGRGVAGDVDDLAWLNGRKPLADLRAQASPRWVHNDQVWSRLWAEF